MCHATRRAAAAHIPMRVTRRSLAILPQVPVLSNRLIRKEERLRKIAESAASWQQRFRREAALPPDFSRLKRPGSLLRLYDEKRDTLRPTDAAAALFSLGRLNRHSAYKVGRDPLADHPLAQCVRADVAACAPHLSSRPLANALLGAAYLRSSDETLLSALCEAAAGKARGHFRLRDVASVVYALGRLQRPDAALMPALLSRVSSEAREMHALEMSLTCNGLADLHLAPPTALSALSNAAVAKIGDFGASELPMLLSALASLGWHDELLLRMSATHLPLLLTDMDPKGLATSAAVFAAGSIYIPAALQDLSAEAALKSELFSARHCAVTLTALGRMQWEDPAAIEALTARLAAHAKQQRAALTDMAITVRALSRMPTGGGAVHAALPLLLDSAVLLLDRRARGGRPMDDAELMRDLATLCNGVVQLGATPPRPLVEHARAALEAASDASHADGSARGLRRTRAKLNDFLRRWE